MRDGIDERIAAMHTRDMTTNQIIASKTAAAKEQQLREAIAALPASYLAMLGLDTPAAINAYVAAEMEDES